MIKRQQAGCIFVHHFRLAHNKQRVLGCTLCRGTAQEQQHTLERQSIPEGTMGKRRHKGKARQTVAVGQTADKTAPDREGAAEHREDAPARESTTAKRKRAPGALVTWIRGKRPVLGFVLLFALLMGLFYAVTFVPYVDKKVFPAYMRLNAQVSAALVNIFGEGATAVGTSISSGRFAVDIQHGCDAIDPSALFIAAVLAFPARLRSKLPGLLAGTLVLAVINIVRIVTLFYAGIYFPRAFEAIHVDVWQPVFILLSLTFWVTWAWWATSGRTPQPHASPEAS